ncbi:hypothetical protein MACK_001255 [Theileria orientalis]|uniref:FPL domain-containing protein n=1 Tax=Theileria orientalis TaxID=68886 RepID=A0A976QX60_THEOR|nr:hypothetical protein MACK_001255 [Theileria orientalis]
MTYKSNYSDSNPSYRNSSMNNPSLEKFKYLHKNVLNKESAQIASPSEVVDALKQLAEYLIWEDRNNEDAIFEYFCEENIMDYMTGVLCRSSSRPIRIQLVQTISMLIHNITNKRALYYFLSNNYINGLIMVPEMYAGGDVSSWTISLLKTLSSILDKSTIKFFFLQKRETFPLLDKSLMFLNNHDSMKRAHVMTIILNIFKVKDDDVTEYIINKSKILLQLVLYLKYCWYRLNKYINKYKRFSENILIECDDTLCFIEELMDLEIEPINEKLIYYTYNICFIPLLRNVLKKNRINLRKLERLNVPKHIDSEYLNNTYHKLSETVGLVDLYINNKTNLYNNFSDANSVNDSIVVDQMENDKGLSEESGVTVGVQEGTTGNHPENDTKTPMNLLQNGIETPVNGLKNDKESLEGMRVGIEEESSMMCKLDEREEKGGIESEGLINNVVYYIVVNVLMNCKRKELSKPLLLLFFTPFVPRQLLISLESYSSALLVTENNTPMSNTNTNTNVTTPASGRTYRGDSRELESQNLFDHVNYQIDESTIEVYELLVKYLEYYDVVTKGNSSQEEYDNRKEEIENNGENRGNIEFDNKVGGETSKQQSEEQPGEQPGEQVNEQLNEQLGEQLSQQLGEQLNEQSNEQVNEHLGEQLNEQSNEQVNEHLGELLNEQSNEQPYQQSNEDSGQKMEEDLEVVDNGLKPEASQLLEPERTFNTKMLEDVCQECVVNVLMGTFINDGLSSLKYKDNKMLMLLKLLINKQSQVFGLVLAGNKNGTSTPNATSDTINTINTSNTSNTKDVDGSEMEHLFRNNYELLPLSSLLMNNNIYLQIFNVLCANVTNYKLNVVIIKLYNAVLSRYIAQLKSGMGGSSSSGNVTNGLNSDSTNVNAGNGDKDSPTDANGNSSSNSKNSHKRSRKQAEEELIDELRFHLDIIFNIIRLYILNSIESTTLLYVSVFYDEWVKNVKLYHTSLHNLIQYEDVLPPEEEDVENIEKNMARVVNEEGMESPSRNQANLKKDQLLKDQQKERLIRRLFFRGSRTLRSTTSMSGSGHDSHADNSPINIFKRYIQISLLFKELYNTITNDNATSFNGKVHLKPIKDTLSYMYESCPLFYNRLDMLYINNQQIKLGNVLKIDDTIKYFKCSIKNRNEQRQRVYIIHDIFFILAKVKQSRKLKPKEDDNQLLKNLSLYSRQNTGEEKNMSQECVHLLWNCLIKKVDTMNSKFNLLISWHPNYKSLTPSHYYNNSHNRWNDPIAPVVSEFDVVFSSPRELNAALKMHNNNKKNLSNMCLMSLQDYLYNSI